MYISGSKLFSTLSDKILDETTIFTDKQKVMFTTQVFFSFKNALQPKARMMGGAQFVVSNK